jgi:hypothetical protein
MYVKYKGPANADRICNCMYECRREGTDSACDVYSTRSLIIKVFFLASAHIFCIVHSAFGNPRIMSLSLLSIADNVRTWMPLIWSYTRRPCTLGKNIQ